MRTRLLAAALALLLVGAVVAVYWPVKDYPFITLDDNLYVTENPLIQGELTADRLAGAFTDRRTGLWIPLTWFSFMLESDLHGLKPGALHVTNVLLHTANVLLLLWLLSRMTGRIPESALAAGLFALHPLHVESVAWVTERKDVLSTFFLLLSLAAYLGYARKRTVPRFLVFTSLYACSLMAKATYVTLPALLLLLDFWPLRRLSLRRPRIQTTQLPLPGLLAEKTPLLFLGLVVTALNIQAQISQTALAPLEFLSVPARLAQAPVSYVIYLRKMLWPSDLAILYPHTLITPSPTVLGVAGVVLVLISAWAVAQRERRPYLLVGWGWYLVGLLPMIGLVQSGHQLVADRFTYIPLMGIFLAAALGLSDLGAKANKRSLVLAGVGIPVLLLCALGSARQVRYWESSVALFGHAAAVTENNYRAHTDMAYNLLLAGRIDEALDHSRKAVAIEPGFDMAQANLGIALALKNNLPEAVVHLQEAVRLEPNNWRARKSLETALTKLKAARPRTAE